MERNFKKGRCGNITSHTTSDNLDKPVMIDLIINEQSLKMELDTGLLISEYQYKQLCKAPTLEKSSVILQTYTSAS